MTGDRDIRAEAEVGIVSFSRDGRSIAGTCRDSKVRFWDVASGNLQRAVAWNPEDMRGVNVPPGAEILLAAGPDKVVKVWNLKDGELIHRLSGHTAATGALAISDDRKLLASSSAREQSVRLWDLGTAKQRFLLRDGIGGAARLVFSPKGDILVGSNYDTNLRVWNTQTGELLRTIEDLLTSMFSLSFSPDGARLATSGADKTVYVWDTRTWTVQQRLTGDPETVSSMTFSGDGNLLAAGGADPTSNRLPSTITIWDVRSGKKIRVVHTAHRVTSVAFDPDGGILAAADGDKTVMLRAPRERVD